MNRKLGTYKTGPNLSSETLFHFTSEFNILELILKDGFQARCIYEKLPGSRLAYFVKTICFCDIPLGQIKEHINWYGTYGIGINRTYAKEKGLSPVIYIHSKSPDFPKGVSKRSCEWYDEKFQFTYYLKQVRGKQMFFNEKNEAYWKWKTFYNEREWRYFPKDKHFKVVQYSNEIELETLKKEMNKSIPSKFYFEPDWIEYILINDSKEIGNLIKILKSNKYKKHYEALLTKVLTFKQIKKDF